MIKTLALILLIMVVGYAILHGLISLYYKMAREEDEDLQYKKDITKEMKDVTEELREETDRLNKTKMKKGK
jgi:hypothetical protein